MRARREHRKRRDRAAAGLVACFVPPDELRCWQCSDLRVDGDGCERDSLTREEWKPRRFQDPHVWRLVGDCEWVAERDTRAPVSVRRQPEAATAGAKRAG